MKITIDKKFKITLIISSILSILFLGLIRFETLWERYPGGGWNSVIFFGLIVLFIWIAIKILIEIIRIIKIRKDLKIIHFIPILIMAYSVIFGIYNPLKINVDELIRGKILFKACYEGTQNEAKFYLREEKKFDVHWTGAFFYDEFFTGVYEKKGDTILLKFNKKQLDEFGDTLIIKGEDLFTKQNDSIFPTYFYLGECKGLN